MPLLSPSTPLRQFYEPTLYNEAAIVKSLQTQIRLLNRQPNANEAVLKGLLFKIPYDGIVELETDMDEPFPHSFVSLAWLPEQDISDIRVAESPDFEDTRVQRQITALRQAAKEARTKKRRKVGALGSTGSPTKSSPLAAAGPLDAHPGAPRSDSVPSLSTGSSETSNTSKLEGVKQCDRALVINWMNNGTLWRNMMAVEEWKIASESERSHVVVPGSNMSFMAPDRSQIGHAQGLLYLVSANEMGGTFLLRIVIGTKFRRAVVLPGNIIVVEDADPARPSTMNAHQAGDGADSASTDQDRTPTKRKARQGASLELESIGPEVSVKAFIHDVAIEARMPWDLADVVRQSTGASATRTACQSAAVYSRFMYEAVRLATERDVEHAAGRRLPDPSPDQTAYYIEIIRAAHEQIRVTDEHIHDLLIYARWDKLSTLVEQEKLRRPRTAPPSVQASSAVSEDAGAAASRLNDPTRLYGSSIEGEGPSRPAKARRRLPPMPDRPGVPRPKSDDEEDPDQKEHPMARGPSASGSRVCNSHGVAQSRSGPIVIDSSAGSSTHNGGPTDGGEAYSPLHNNAAVDMNSEAGDHHPLETRSLGTPLGTTIPRDFGSGPGGAQDRNASRAPRKPHSQSHDLDGRFDPRNLGPPNRHPRTTPSEPPRPPHRPDRTPPVPHNPHLARRLSGKSCRSAGDLSTGPAPLPKAAHRYDHLVSWLSSTSPWAQDASAQNLPSGQETLLSQMEGGAVWADSESAEDADDGTSSLLTSSDSMGPSLPLGELIKLLGDAGVRIWRTTPETLSALITRMVDDSLGTFQERHGV